MTTVLSLFLVLTLTGSPVASLACFATCGQRSTPTGHCHDDSATGTGPMVSEGVRCSAPAVGESPYLTEHRAVPGAAVLATTSQLAMSSPVRADAPAVIPESANGWRVPPLVLRI